MRTTINISDSVVKEAQALYNTTNKSKAIESALKDAIRLKKVQGLISLKGKISFDEKSVDDLRRAELNE